MKRNKTGHTIQGWLLASSLAAGCSGSVRIGADASGGKAGTADAGNSESSGEAGQRQNAAGSGGAQAGSGEVGLSCKQAKDGYAVMLANLLSENASTLCSVNSDCGIIPTSDCGNGCSISIVSTAAGAAISSQLGAFATANCESCKFSVPPCPLPYLPALLCVAGTCQL